MYQRFGGFWRRGCAFLLDQAILQILLAVSLTLAEWLLSRPLLHSPLSLRSLLAGEGTATVLTNGLGLLMSLLYFTSFHGSIGQTPGKKMLGLMVVRQTRDRMTWGVAFLRWAGYLVSAIPLGLGFLWIAVDRKKQGWHDKIAGTLVIRVQKNSD